MPDKPLAERTFQNRLGEMQEVGKIEKVDREWRLVDPALRKAPKAMTLAVGWLRDFLGEGPRDAKEVMAAAEAAGISERTLRRAAEMVAENVKTGSDTSVWTLRTDSLPHPPRDPFARSGILREVAEADVLNASADHEAPCNSHVGKKGL